MIFIFPNTHKIIANELYNEIYRVYNIKLDKKSLIWGSQLPDYSPKHKMIPHYYDKSIDYIVGEIISLIVLARFTNLEESSYIGITKKIFSRKLGIISHYLTDYVTLAHYENWSFKDSMVKHVSYERKLNHIAENFDFTRNEVINLRIDLDDIFSLRRNIRNNIDEVLKLYRKEKSLERDLTFAYNINLNIIYFVIDIINVYSNNLSTAKLGLLAR